jgi:hypothetical protein
VSGLFGSGKKDVQVIGPIEKVSEEVVRLSRPYVYWRNEMNK